MSMVIVYRAAWRRSRFESKAGLRLAHGVPQRQNDELVPFYAVVHKVSNSAKMQTAYAGESAVANLDPNARLAQKQIQRAPEVLPNRERYCRSVLTPPTIRPQDLSCCATRNAQSENHVQSFRLRRAKSSSAEMVSPRSASATASRSSVSSSAER